MSKDDVPVSLSYWVYAIYEYVMGMQSDPFKLVKKDIEGVVQRVRSMLVNEVNYMIILCFDVNLDV